VLPLYEDAFLGGAVADFVDLATGAGEPGGLSISRAMVAERLERRGFDIDTVTDEGAIELPDAEAAARWIAEAPPLDRPLGGKGRGSSIRIRARGDLTVAQWPRSAAGAAEWSRYVAAPDRLTVICRAPASEPASLLLPLCAHGGHLWHVGATGPVEVPLAAAGVAAGGAEGCVRLRIWLVVEGHPSGPLGAELAVVWLRGTD
jgi:hypothetical protein